MSQCQKKTATGVQRETHHAQLRSKNKKSMEKYVVNCAFHDPHSV